MNRLPILLLCAPMALPAAASDDPLRRCRGLADAAQRLACYDAIPLAAVATAPTASTARAPVAQAAPAAATGAAAAAAAAAITAEQAFGRRVLTDADRLEQVVSHIEGRFTGWEPGQRLRLANGQVWRVEDGSRGVYWLENPRVTVRRAALGSFRLEIEGTTAFVRVTRVD